MKKLSILLVTLLLMSMFAGCNKTDTQSEITSKSESVTVQANENTSESTAIAEPVTIGWIGTAYANYLDTAFPDDRVIKELEKRTGVRIDWSMNVGVADINGKIAVLLASGDLPDVVMPVNSEELGAKLIAAKSVIPLDDLVDKYGPDIKKNASKMIAFNKISRSDETNALYCIAMGVGFSNLGQDSVSESWSLRWDLYKQLGYPKITNYDEFLDVLKEMLKLEPVNADGKKNYGLGLFLAEDWGDLLIDRAMMFENGYSNLISVKAVYVNTVTNKVEPRLTDPDGVFWKSMAFLNKAYNEGVLDPESATLKFQTYNDKMATNRYMAAGNGWMIGTSDTNLRSESNGEKGFLPILISPNPNGIWALTSLEAGNQACAYISTNCKVPEKVISLLNFCATSEGNELLNNGVEGIDWEMKDGKPVLIGERLQAAINNTGIDVKATGIGKYSWQLCVNSNPMNEKGYFTNFTYNTPEIPKLPIVLDYIKHYNISFLQENFTKFPKYSYDYGFQAVIATKPNTDMDRINTDINNFVQTDVIKLIFLKDESQFLKMKEECINKMKSMGADDLVQYCATLYDDFNKKLESMLK